MEFPFAAVPDRDLLSGGGEVIKDGWYQFTGESGIGVSLAEDVMKEYACRNYKVCYFGFTEFVESLVSLKNADYEKYKRKVRLYERLDLLIIDDFLLNTVTDERETKVLFEVLNNRNEHSKSTIICSQREPKSWASMHTRKGAFSISIAN